MCILVVNFASNNEYIFLWFNNSFGPFQGDNSRQCNSWATCHALTPKRTFLCTQIGQSFQFWPHQEASAHYWANRTCFGWKCYFHSRWAYVSHFVSLCSFWTLYGFYWANFPLPRSAPTKSQFLASPQNYHSLARKNYWRRPCDTPHCPIVHCCWIRIVDQFLCTFCWSAKLPS